MVNSPELSASQYIGLLLEIQEKALTEVETSVAPAEDLINKLLRGKSEFAHFSQQIRSIPASDRQRVGATLNEVKQSIIAAITNKTSTSKKTDAPWFDVTAPGIRPPIGHLHLVTQTIMEVTRIFERIGFTRVRHPEVDWDWYPFESLNMPPNHPARDEWETFFIEYPGKPGKNQKKQRIVLTPHTSNGQVREMEKGKLPIRMINIAKCYRRQEDVSHTAMFHQFEGLYVDKNVSIGELKGVMDFFFKQFYGPDRSSRIRPFHFQFTEPSFEVDVSCGACHGQGCRLCKEGWLELGGAGMIHPVVLRNGGIDPDVYNGFAFGWGIERVAIMKTQGINDNRNVYSNDVRLLEQF